MLKPSPERGLSEGCAGVWWWLGGWFGVFLVYFRVLGFLVFLLIFLWGFFIFCLFF